MKKKVTLVIAAMSLLGLALAVYAYNSTQSTTKTVAAACCCHGGDSCPMKSAGETSHNCCVDSCPMRSRDAKSVDKATSSADSADSCPMMKDGKGHEMHTGMNSDDGKDSCCSCCNHAKKEVTASI